MNNFAAKRVNEGGQNPSRNVCIECDHHTGLICYTAPPCSQSTPSVQSIVGGTGVFRGASGELTITTVPNPDTTPGALPFSKYSISLDRSPRCAL